MMFCTSVALAAKSASLLSPVVNGVHGVRVRSLSMLFRMRSCDAQGLEALQVFRTSLSRNAFSNALCGLSVAVGPRSRRLCPEASPAACAALRELVYGVQVLLDVLQVSTPRRSARPCPRTSRLLQELEQARGELVVCLAALRTRSS